MQPALFGGLFIGVLSALPIVNVANCCCLWVIGGGVVSAYLAAQDASPGVTLGRGAREGLLAGCIGAVVWLVLTLALSVVLQPFQEAMAAELLRRSRAMPPETREWFESLASSAPSPMRHAVGFFFQLGIGVVFAPIGGMLGALYFRKDVPPALGGDYVPPLPPS